LTEQNAVPLIVLSTARDPVEAINSTLRRAGHPVHCTWIPDLRDLADALTQINPELLIHVASGTIELKSTIAIRDEVSPTVPILVLADALGKEPATEALITDALLAGARDLVSLSSPTRLNAVVLRELRAFRLERALNTTVKSARDAQIGRAHV